MEDRRNRKECSSEQAVSWGGMAAILVSLSDLVSLAVAQGPARPPVGQPMVGQPMAGQTIALLDVTYIFKNHNRFKALMEQMKASVQCRERR